MDVEASFTSPDTHVFIRVKKKCLFVSSKYFSYSLVFSYSENGTEIRQRLRISDHCFKKSGPIHWANPGTNPASVTSVWLRGI